MAKLTVTQIDSKEDRIEMRWQVMSDDGSRQNNYFGTFSIGNQSSIDEALKKALSSFDFADTVAQVYVGKIVSLDDKGGIQITDKPVIEPPPDSGQV